MKRVDILYADEDWINFRVKSDSSEEYQYVCYDGDDGWICTCEDFYYRRNFCKHMKRAREYLDLLNGRVQKCDVVFKGRD